MWNNVPYFFGIHFFALCLFKTHIPSVSTVWDTNLSFAAAVALQTDWKVINQNGEQENILLASLSS